MRWRKGCWQGITHDRRLRGVCKGSPRSHIAAGSWPRARLMRQGWSGAAQDTMLMWLQVSFSPSVPPGPGAGRAAAHAGSGACPLAAPA